MANKDVIFSDLYGEVWKDITGFDGYQISNLGRVRSCRFGTRTGVKFKYWREITTSFNGRKSHVLIDLVDKAGKRKSYSLHRILYEMFVGIIPDGMCIDHKDRNGLNNSLDNLRLSTQSTNVANQKTRSHRKYKGVYKTKSNMWECATSYKSKRVYLGRFATEIEAAKAYNEYALKVFGEFAVLNMIPSEVN